MDVLPRACAGLLLLSLLCAAALCQRSQCECSRGRSVCSPSWCCAGGACTPLLASRRAGPRVDKTCCVPLLISIPRPWGPPSCRPAAGLQPAPSSDPGKTSAGSQRREPPFSRLPAAHSLFSVPDALVSPADNRCVLSRAKSCTECIRVDKDCSFCTDEVSARRGARGSAAQPAAGASRHPGESRERTREQGQLLAPASPCKELVWTGSTTTWVSFGGDRGGGLWATPAGTRGLVRKRPCAGSEPACEGLRESLGAGSPVTRCRWHFPVPGDTGSSA